MQPVGIYVEESDGSGLLSELFRDSEPDPLRGAGDYDHSIREASSLRRLKATIQGSRSEYLF